MADQQTIHARVDLARQWLSLGMPASAAASKLARVCEVSRATAYRAVEAALMELSQSDQEPDREDSATDTAAQALAAESILAAQEGDPDSALKLARAAETLGRLRGSFSRKVPR